MSQPRHPATVQILKHFRYEHLTIPALHDTSKAVALVAHELVQALPDGPELTAGLRKLLEAKDCFVRAALEGVEVAR